MSQLRRLTRGLQAKKTKIAAIMVRLQAIEPDMKKLRANFEQVLTQATTQREIEVFEAKPL